MPRNFDRRVEVMFPIEDPDLRQRVLEEIIPTYLRDNQRARQLRPDGAFVRVRPGKNDPSHRSQQELLELAGWRSVFSGPLLERAPATPPGPSVGSQPAHPGAKGAQEKSPDKPEKSQEKKVQSRKPPVSKRPAAKSKDKPSSS